MISYRTGSLDKHVFSKGDDYSLDYKKWQIPQKIPKYANSDTNIPNIFFVSPKILNLPIVIEEKAQIYMRVAYIPFHFHPEYICHTGISLKFL